VSVNLIGHAERHYSVLTPAVSCPRLHYDNDTHFSLCFGSLWSQADCQHLLS